MPAADHLVWIDLEMTGLQPETDQIIEIATIVTDKDLTILAEGPVLALHQPPEVLARIRRQYEPGALAIDFTDGLSVEFADWRFNLRASNTEPLVRLNVEARGSAALMREKTQQLLERLRG